jgi:hypothetical protein
MAAPGPGALPRTPPRAPGRLPVRQPYPARTGRRVDRPARRWPARPAWNLWRRTLPR